MKRVSIKIVVPAEVGVTAQMVNDLLANQVHFLLTETKGGEIRWKDAILQVAELPR
jgi:hypothetical protein